MRNVIDVLAIQKAFMPLIGLPLCRFGRAAGLLWLGFGELHKISTRDGGTKIVGDWALHVQCAWRLCQNGHIVVADHDYYCSPEGDDLDNWDIPGDSKFDKVVESLMIQFELNPLVIVSVSTDDVGGFSLELTNDYRLDVFPNSSGGYGEYDEFWRLFSSTSNSRHFVIP